MAALVLLLVVTNLITAAVLVRLWRRQRPDVPEPAAELAELTANLARQPTATTGTRRIISVEILNPIELAATRGRVVGIAGSFAPGITRRVVYEQAVKTLRRQLIDQHVVADVRLHALRPARPGEDQQAAGFVDAIETPGRPPDADPQPPR